MKEFYIVKNPIKNGITKIAIDEKFFKIDHHNSLIIYHSKFGIPFISFKEKEWYVDKVKAIDAAVKIKDNVVVALLRRAEKLKHRTFAI